MKPARSIRGSSARSTRIVEPKKRSSDKGLPKTAGAFRRLKAHGLFRCAARQADGHSEAEVTKRRRALDVRPVYKRIDTCAAEFASPTAYMYSTYEPPFAGAFADEARPSDKKKVIDPGRRAQPHRPGHRVRLLLLPCRLRAEGAGYETIMVNCNPETVSTDYDTSDRLYFEPLTAEDVLEISHANRTTARCMASSCSSAARRR